MRSFHTHSAPYRCATVSRTEPKLDPRLRVNCSPVSEEHASSVRRSAHKLYWNRKRSSSGVTIAVLLRKVCTSHSTMRFVGRGFSRDIRAYVLKGFQPLKSFQTIFRQHATRVAPPARDVAHYSNGKIRCRKGIVPVERRGNIPLRRGRSVRPLPRSAARISAGGRSSSPAGRESPEPVRRN